MRHVVGIPARSLAEPTLRATLEAIGSQRLRPNAIVISLPPGIEVKAQSLAGVTSTPCRVIAAETPGTASQRNAILEEAGDDDVAHFVDSDIQLHPDYLGNIVRHLERTDLVGVCGVIEVGTLGSGRRSLAKTLLRRLAMAEPPPGRVSRSGIVSSPRWAASELQPTMWMSAGAMSVRMDAVGDIRFCEDLQRGPTGPYAMAEDVHYSLLLSSRGRMARAADCRALHNGDEAWKSRDPAFWEGKVWSRMLLARDFPTVVSPPAVRYAAVCDLLAQTLLSRGARRQAAREGLARGLVNSFRATPSPRPTTQRSTFLEARDIQTGRLLP